MKWRYAAVVGAVVIALINAFLLGKRTGESQLALKQNAEQIHKSDSSIKSVQIRTIEADKQDSILTQYRSHVREKVVVRRDTILLASNGNTNGKCSQNGNDCTQNGNDSVVVVSPEIAQLLQADDSLIKAQARSIALRDTLIANLRQGIALRDVRIDILERAQNPGKFQKILAATRWVAVGALVGAAFVHK